MDGRETNPEANPPNDATPLNVDDINTRRDAALEYVRIGWAVVPLHWIHQGRCSCGKNDCRTPGKHPHGSYAPHGTHSASKDAATVRQWYMREPRLNIGIALGEVSGIVVLDVDPRNGGDDTLQQIIQTYGALPETASAITGGGQHFIFKYAGQRVKSPGKGLDALSNGKLIVVEPSTHASGRNYAWDAAADPLEGAAIADPPAWMLDTIARRNLAGNLPPAPVVVGYLDPRRIEDLRAALPNLDADNYDTWIGVGQALHSTDAPEAFELWDTWARKSPKYEPGEARRKWSTYRSSGGLNVESIFAWARAAGWQKDVEGGAAIEPSGTLKIVSLSDFHAAKPEPPRFAVEPLVPLSYVTLLGAHGGTGKSMLALTIAAHFAAHRPWARFGVAGGEAVFVSLEDPPSLVRFRLRKIVEEYQLDPAAIAANLRVIDGSDGDGTLATEVSQSSTRRLIATANMANLRALVGAAKLIMIDNASDAYDANENDRRMVRGFVRMLAQVARENDAGVVLLAHIDKDAAKYGAKSNSYSGSTAWHNSARSRMALVDEKGSLELRQEKLNLGRCAEPLALRWSDGGVLIPSDDEVSEAERITESLIVSNDAKTLLVAFRAAALADANIPTGRTGPSTAQAALETFDELPATLRGANGRKRFWAALGRLHRDGHVRPEAYRNNNRKEAKRFVMVSAPV